MASVRDLITDSAGRYDEAAIGFLVGLATLIWATVYSTLYPDHPFHAENFSIGLGALLGLYNAGKGRVGKIGANQ